ncbi:MAG: hypothetical protein LH631_13165 [Alkalinema sp. CAN_BIN05]|nr:hypothetical protein [Alkalinema sp. CAN_BIN05]
MVEILPVGLNVCFSFDLQFIHIHFTRHSIINLKYISIVASSITFLSVAAFSNPASASHYRTTSGNTSLDIKEGGTYANGLVGLGYYFTMVGSTEWRGNLNAPLNTGLSTGLVKVYQGTFSDSKNGSGAGIQQCTGNIKIVRTQTGSNHAATVTWRILGGTGCPSPINSQTTLSLNETRPVANFQGDFTASQANTIKSETAGLATWISWKVVDPTPLNCRTTPTGSIVTSFPTGTLLNASYLGVNGIVMNSGVPWLTIRHAPNQYCVVRANTSRIKPLLLPY